MRRPLLLLVAVCLGTTIAVAQSAPQPDSICELHLNKVKPGMTSQYEQGRTKHMAWHKSQNDAWTWETWEVTTGKNTGGYVIVTCDHAWKDFDAREKFNVADSQNANATMGNTLAEENMSYWSFLADMSDPWKPGPPPAYLSELIFHVKPEGYSDFRNAVKQINEGFKKTNTPRVVSHWYALANGGSGPVIALVQERKSMADMQAMSNKSLDEIMKEAYGEQGASTMATLRKAYSWTETDLLHFRPDLSYMAPMAK